MTKTLALVCLLASAAATVWAQAPIGSIAGTVTDESGGVVGGATVTITNKATGLKRELKTDSEGTFSAPALPAGDYEVRGQMTGFRQLVREAESITSAFTMGLACAKAQTADSTNRQLTNKTEVLLIYPPEMVAYLFARGLLFWTEAMYLIGTGQVNA